MTPTMPRAASPENERGCSLFRLGDLAGALDEFDRAIQAEPDSATAFNNRGLARQASGDLAGALADFDHALTLRPDYADALGNRGLAYRSAGRLGEALADLDRAVALAPDAGRAIALHNRAAIRQLQGDLEAARADLNEALTLDPLHGPSWTARGTVRLQLGDTDSALADLDRAVELATGDSRADAYHARAAVHAKRRRFAAAITDCDAALQVRPDWVIASVSRGHARYHVGDGRAILDYVRALQLDATAAADEIVRVLAEHVRDDAGLVLENCAKHLRSNPDDVAALMRRGLTLLLLGDDLAAQTDLDRAVGVLPRFRRPWDVMIAAVRTRRLLEANEFDPSNMVCGVAVG